MGSSILFRAGLFLAGLILVVSIPSFAAPFLVSDPYPKGRNQPTEFDVVCGELRFSTAPETLPDGRKRLRFDLSQLPDGDFTLEIKAVDKRLRRESIPVTIRLHKDGTDVTLLPAGSVPPPPQPPQAAPEKEKIPPSRTFQGRLKSPD